MQIYLNYQKIGKQNKQINGKLAEITKTTVFAWFLLVPRLVFIRLGKQWQNAAKFANLRFLVILAKMRSLMLKEPIRVFGTKGRDFRVQSELFMEDGHVETA